MGALLHRPARNVAKRICDARTASQFFCATACMFAHPAIASANRTSVTCRSSHEHAERSCSADTSRSESTARQPRAAHRHRDARRAARARAPQKRGTRAAFQDAHAGVPLDRHGRRAAHRHRPRAAASQLGPDGGAEQHLGRREARNVRAPRHPRVSAGPEARPFAEGHLPRSRPLPAHHRAHRPRNFRTARARAFRSPRRHRQPGSRAARAHRGSGGTSMGENPGRACAPIVVPTSYSWTT